MILLFTLVPACNHAPSEKPSNIFEAVAFGNLRSVESFARGQRSLVNATDSATGHTPLELAITFRRVSIARWLLRHGANPNADHGRPLFIAAWGLHFHAVLMLVRAGATPDPRIRGQMRLLESPGHDGLPDYLLRERIILWYLKKQADLILPGHSGGTAHEGAERPGRTF